MKKITAAVLIISAALESDASELYMRHNLMKDWSVLASEQNMRISEDKLPLNIIKNKIFKEILEKAKAELKTHTEDKYELFADLFSEDIADRFLEECVKDVDHDGNGKPFYQNRDLPAEFDLKALLKKIARTEVGSDLLLNIIAGLRCSSSDKLTFQTGRVYSYVYDYGGNFSSLIKVSEKPIKQKFLEFPKEGEIKLVTKTKKPEQSLFHELTHFWHRIIFGGENLNAKSQEKIYKFFNINDLKPITYMNDDDMIPVPLTTRGAKSSLNRHYSNDEEFSTMFGAAGKISGQWYFEPINEAVFGLEIGEGVAARHLNLIPEDNQVNEADLRIMKMLSDKTEEGLKFTRIALEGKYTPVNDNIIKYCREITERINLRKSKWKTAVDNLLTEDNKLITVITKNDVKKTAVELVQILLTPYDMKLIIEAVKNFQLKK